MKVFTVIMWFISVFCFLWLVLLANLLPKLFAWSWQQPAVLIIMILSFVSAVLGTFELLGDKK